MKDILEKLVSIPTVTGESVPIGVAINYIEDYLLERGMKVERLVSDGHASLVATASGTKTPKVMLAAHVDVSPGSDEQFFLRETAGRLYGRGVVDMKFAIASYLQIVDDLRNQLNKYDFGIMITSDEEEGGLNGTAHLVNKGYLPKVCVLPDGGDNWQIQTFAKGFFYLEITVHGKAAHGSRPWLGDNAIVTLTHVITDIAALFPDMSADTNTYNIGLVRGGDSVNQVADHAHISLEIRVISETEKTRLLEQITALCRAHKAEFEVVLDGTTCHFTLDNKYVAPFVQAVQEVTGVTIKGSRSLGASDARYFAARHIPCVSLYPTGGNHHGPDEWIDKKAFYDFKVVIQRYLDAVARIPEATKSTAELEHVA